ncbi:Sulfite oxidase OS=Streptomyces microflavus OX=1919 GN=Smic_01720 PE=4 SV=1 [Streptomyces microflavus]
MRLGDVLRRAGIGRHAVDVLPRGLDAEVVTDGVNLGRVRRPLPVAKALDDALLRTMVRASRCRPTTGIRSG